MALFITGVLINARIGLRTADGLWDISVWARNLLDEKYFTNISGGNTGRIAGVPGDPRTFGMTFRTKL